jgi:hypothetical protein
MYSRALLIAVAVVACITVSRTLITAQTPARGAQPGRQGGAPAAASTAVRPTISANLAQVMRGILFPNSNVIFAAQHDEFLEAKPDPDTSLSTNPITGLYGGWQAAENSALALSEATNLIIMPGRRCSNGKPVPIGDPDFQKFVGDLRVASQGALKAAQSKDQDQILEAADKVAVACSHCHTMFREKTEAQGGEANRCTK